MQQGFFSIQQTCPDCRGRGTVISSPCSDCQGSGTVQKTKTLQVKVPAGVDDGDQIRLAGEGQGSTALVGDRLIAVLPDDKAHRVRKSGLIQLS